MSTEPKPIYTMDLTRGHQIYRNAAGKRVPGVTTILGIVAKPQLIKWANNLGLEGIDSDKVRDNAATIGSIAHGMCEAYIRGMEFDTSNLNPADVDKAETAFIKFCSWWDENGFTMVHSELQMVSEEWQVGGTADIIAYDRDFKVCLIDLKTNKKIYPEALVQTSAYAQMYTETHEVMVNRRIVCRIGKEDEGDFEHREVQRPDVCVKFFGILVDAYRLKQSVDKLA